MKHHNSYEAFGQFIISPEQCFEKWQNCKAIIFDWDGVFNNGHKDINGASTFSEIDSMGTNLLRLSAFLKHKNQMVIAVISGETNPIAKNWVLREHVHALYSGVKNKSEALQHFCQQHQLSAHEVAFVFDDVLDFSLAQICGLRLMIKDAGKTQTTAFAIKNNLVDYLSACAGGAGAVREVCELLMGLNQNDSATIEVRVKFGEAYSIYITQRNKIATRFYEYSISEGVKELS